MYGMFKIKLFWELSRDYCPKDQYCNPQISGVPKPGYDGMSRKEWDLQWKKNPYWYYTNKKFNEVFLNPVFLKYLLVKYNYLLSHPSYPLTGLKGLVKYYPSFARVYLTDFFYGEYHQVFDIRRTWIKEYGIDFPRKDRTDDRLIEVYFGYHKGTLKPLEYYVNEPVKPYDRYAPLP